MSSNQRWGKQKVSAPDGEIRRSQILTSYGAGSLIDLIDQAVLVGGLDFWSYDLTGHNVIHESRLRDALAERLDNAGRALSNEHAFREPPVGDRRQPSRSSGIEVLAMPQWFVCQCSQRSRPGARGGQLPASRYAPPSSTSS